jgi:hypothetical protein
MAASAYFMISAKDETKAGIKSALNGLNGLKSGASSAVSGLTAVAGKIGGAFAAIGIAGMGISSIKDSVTAFQESEGAAIKLAQAVRNSPLIDGTGFANITKYTAQLQSQIGVDEDLMNAQASLVVGMGLTEDQTLATLAAATDLAAAGVMPLEEAVKALGKTYSGNLGTLGKQIPALKNLTEAELKNGEAVKAVAANYKGMAEQMSKTGAGIYQTFQASMGELQEAIGKPFSEIGIKLIEAIRPGIEKVTTFISDNSYKVVNFFANLPEIALTALSMLPKIFETVLSFDFIKAFFEGLFKYYTEFLPALGKGIFEWFVSGFKGIGSFIIGISAGLWVPIKNKFGEVIGGIRIFFAEIINFFIERINDFLKGLNKIGDLPLVKKALGAVGLSVDFKTIDLIDAKKLGETIAAEQKKAAGGRTLDQQIEDERKKFYGFGVDGLTEALHAFDGVIAAGIDTVSPALAVLGDELKPLRDKILGLINTVKENTGAVKAETIAAGGATSGGAPGFDWSSLLEKLGINSTESAKGLIDAFKEGWGQLFSGGGLGELGPAITGLITPAIGAITPIISALGSLAGPIAILAVIVTGLMSILGPAITGIIQPLFNALMFIGQMLGGVLLPIFDALAPVISIVSQLLISMAEPIAELLIPLVQLVASLIQIVVLPIIKMVAIAFEVLYSPIKWVGDLFLWFGAVIKAIGNNINEYIVHLFDPNNRQLQAIPAFSSTAFTGLAERIAAIWQMGSTSSFSNSLYGNDWADFQSWMTNGMNTIPFEFSTPGGGTAASYQARDITINFYNEAPAVGDEGLRRLALILREQLAEAEAMGA